MYNLITRTFESQTELEKRFKESAPEILYKFSGFDKGYVKSSFEETKLYFASPKQLNDEYDIRLPLEIDYSDVEKPDFIEKLKKITQRVYPHLNPSSLEFIDIVSQKFLEIKANPKAYYEKNIKEVRDGEIYEQFGVLSLTSDYLNDKMWGYYAESNKGFCVGYDTYGLFNYGAGSFGKVIYSNEPLKLSLVEPPMDDFPIRTAFQKGLEWEHEAEYRFVNYMEFLKNRLKKFPQEIVREVVIGSQISKENYEFIISTLINKYKHAPKLFKIEKSLNSFQLNRVEIFY